MEPATHSMKTLAVTVMDEDGTETFGTFTATLSVQAVGRILSFYPREPSPQGIPVLIWVETREMTTLRDLAAKGNLSDGGGTPPATGDHLRYGLTDDDLRGQMQ